MQVLGGKDDPRHGNGECDERVRPMVASPDASALLAEVLGFANLDFESLQPITVLLQEVSRGKCPQ